MSVEATTWAWKQATRSSGQRLVLLALADHASCHDDEEGFTCWPKIATISDMADIGDSTVRAHIDTLCEDGLLEKVERKVYGTRAGPNIYRLPVERRSKTAGGAAVKTAGGAAVIPIPEPLQGEPLSGGVEIVDPWERAFDDWYSTYPKKVGRLPASKAFKSKLKGMSHAQMVQLSAGSLAWQRFWREDGTEMKYIPYPATFLNREQYNDEPPPLAKPKQSSIMESISKIRERDSQ